MREQKQERAPLRDLHHIRARYDILLCDVWGTLYDGIRPISQIVRLCQDHLNEGRSLVVISNSPKLTVELKRRLRNQGIPEAILSHVITSGQMAHKYLANNKIRQIFHIGPTSNERILSCDSRKTVRPEEAQIILCSGLYNDTTETPSDYHSMLSKCRSLNLTMLCSNPDYSAPKGSERRPCAGTIAELYRDMGGKVIFTGKPCSAIYTEAISLISHHFRHVHKSEILALGDDVRTDVQGARNFGIDCVQLEWSSSFCDFTMTHHKTTQRET